MLKFIQYVCLLFLVCSCSTRNEESVILQNETDMEKKNLGSVLALYPKPMTVVGAVVNEKVNWPCGFRTSCICSLRFISTARHRNKKKISSQITTIHGFVRRFCIITIQSLLLNEIIYLTLRIKRSLIR
jgi:hypothetical protein